MVAHRCLFQSSLRLQTQVSDCHINETVIVYLLHNLANTVTNLASYSTYRPLKLKRFS